MQSNFQIFPRDPEFVGDFLLGRFFQIHALDYVCVVCIQCWQDAAQTGAKLIFELWRLSRI